MDTHLPLLIAGITGAVLGGMIAAAIAGALHLKAQRRLEKHTWRQATLYFDRKAAAERSGR
jgi:hypothetical protein